MRIHVLTSEQQFSIEKSEECVRVDNNQSMTEFGHFIIKGVKCSDIAWPYHVTVIQVLGVQWFTWLCMSILAKMVSIVSNALVNTFNMAYHHVT